MDFKKVNILDKPLYDSFLNSNNNINNNYLASELNFANLFCWNISDNIEICFTDTAIFVKARYDEEYIFLPPLVKDTKHFLPSIKMIEEYTKDVGIKFCVRSLTKEMVDILEQSKHDYIVEYNRDYSEYLYSTEDLVTLVGKKFNSKRNHLNFFKNNYNFSFKNYDKKDKQRIINLFFEWKMATNNPDTFEQVAIDNAIAFYDKLDLKCSYIEVDKKVIAFTVGFINRNNCGIVMFEKANPEYRGSYPAINQMFAEQSLNTASFINRQEDMGIEGLRKAKLSYNPIGMVDKFDLYLEK